MYIYNIYCALALYDTHGLIRGSDIDDMAELQERALNVLARAALCLVFRAQFTCETQRCYMSAKLTCRTRYIIYIYEKRLTKYSGHGDKLTISCA